MIGNKIIFIAFALGTLVGGVGVSILNSGKGGECVCPQTPKCDQVVAQEGGTDAQEQKKCEIKVEVAGAVARAGVVCLEEGSIVDDALREVGGWEKSLMAYKYVTQNLNLARLLVQGEKIYVPYQDDVICKKKEEWKSPVEIPLVSQGDSTDASGKGENSAESIAKCVSLNNASKAELESLSGVGSATAQKIIDGRPYAKLEDLKNVSGIGDATYEKLKTDICL